jgi:hypothetical protein
MDTTFWLIAFIALPVFGLIASLFCYHHIDPCTRERGRGQAISPLRKL